MPRIPYTDAALAEPKDVVDAIRLRRGGHLLNLDRMLLHSPAFARGWNAFLGEVRGGLDLSPKLRELAMCVVAVLNGAEYEFHHHAPEFIKAGGSEQQARALRQPQACVGDPFGFDPGERAVIALTIEMTRGVRVADATFAAALDALGSHRHVVELVGVIAAYNMVSRFLVAFDIAPETTAV
ncbi:carboxymuconolactone decarboxylase family protein [Janthinobacterium sp.]|uniref:carboxymuconolactone decarboxylase family protein n=1 Tax=Janthinobacterium sp. TaxID=1871054 RepID=UPI00293D2939|nr:carboxymuconolactone decarboxylase family protein [Janthinobacterium sp.]